jgi:hypothetical protein
LSQASRIYAKSCGLCRDLAWPSYTANSKLFPLGMDLDPSQYGEADRRQVDPPVQVESAGGTLDWWVRERREWFGRVRGQDGRQKWIKAADLRPKEAR